LGVEHLTSNLKGLSIQGSVATVATEILKFGLQIGSLVVLARLLSPEDYGLIGMVNVILVFVSLLGDFGLSAATIQKDEINHQQVSTLFWINVAIGCSIAAIVAALAPIVASFYNEPRLIGITLALATGYIISSLAPQHEALLRRQMRFVSLAKIQLVSLLAGIITATASALYGMGYWALVHLQLMMGIVKVVGVWTACGWRPGLPVWNCGIRSMLIFGGNSTGFQVFHYFSRNLDNILIGRYWGAQQLGLYAKAYQLLMLPIQQFTSPIAGVALPALSRLKDEPDRYRTYYYKAVLSIATLGMPLVAFMCISADKIILAILGQQWLATVSIFRFLAPAAFLGTFTWTGWIYQSQGRTERLLQWGIISSTVDSIAFAIGVRWGVIGVAAAFSLSQLILLVPTFTYCFKGTSLQLTKLAVTLSRPAFASIVAAVTVIGIEPLLSINSNAQVGLLLDCVFYGLFYFSIWMVIPGGKHTLLEMLRIVRNLNKSFRT
jgi:O-antigen/teichoic acid export membrane protein